MSQSGLPPPGEGHDFAREGAAPAAQASPERAQLAEEEAAVGVPCLESTGFYVSMARRAPAPVAPNNGEQLAILVVEDDPDLAQLLIDVFMNAGFAMRWAANRAEINAELNRKPAVDLVLMDINLPDANGLQVLQGIRSHPALGTLPVVMMTGMATAQHVAMGLLAGADGYVTKPFKVSGLVQAVDQVLGRN